VYHASRLASRFLSHSCCCLLLLLHIGLLPLLPLMCGKCTPPLDPEALSLPAVTPPAEEPHNTPESTQRRSLVCMSSVSTGRALLPVARAASQCELRHSTAQRRAGEAGGVMPLGAQQGVSQVIRRCLMVGLLLLLLSGPEAQIGLLHLGARAPPVMTGVPDLMLLLPAECLPRKGCCGGIPCSPGAGQGHQVLGAHARCIQWTGQSALSGVKVGRKGAPPGQLADPSKGTPHPPESPALHPGPPHHHKLGIILPCPAPLSDITPCVQCVRQCLGASIKPVPLWGRISPAERVVAPADPADLAGQLTAGQLTPDPEPRPITAAGAACVAAACACHDSRPERCRVCIAQVPAGPASQWAP